MLSKQRPDRIPDPSKERPDRRDDVGEMLRDLVPKTLLAFGLGFAVGSLLALFFSCL